MFHGFKAWLFTSLLVAAFAVLPAQAKTLSFPLEMPEPPAVAAASAAEMEGSFLCLAVDGQLYLAAAVGKNPHTGQNVYVLSPLGLWILKKQSSDLQYREVVAEEDGESIEELVAGMKGSGLHLLGAEAFARREYPKVKLPKPSLSDLPPGMSPVVDFKVDESDSSDQGGWLRHDDGTRVRDLREIKKGQTYRVPNTVLVTLGYVNVQNLTSITTANEMAEVYKQKGFFVRRLPYEMKEARGLIIGQGTEGNIISEMDEALGRHDIAGWAHAGHGFEDPITKKTPGSLIVLLGDEKTGVLESDFQLHHHLSEVVLYVCFAGKNEGWVNMVTPGGIIRMTDKRLGTLPGPGFDPWTKLPTRRVKQ